ncbi:MULTISPECIES: universal stress protein [Isoptericola]|uniref:Universal stress protein n=1 Tax=Isoptericola sediminis TaxID=2733572 RepID=A0A849K9A7_9MICO|nr:MULTISPECIES: universal stress protein [Isoptericola]MDO8144237.1 universal stress protein [Isoptericola sp. 178]MDO8148091.1 universal stress protein [Isoptericola sp. b515]MDO8151567.1 universal stress protein [Isoptericola sp. b408]NNU27797.1 universal stress protein [Isoptericola sediminis]
MTVLVAYRACPHGEAAVRTALEESRRRDLPLRVLVLDAQDPGDGPSAELSAILGDTDAAISYRDEDTEPADAILDTADEVGADLVVVGSRKRSSHGTFLMGTTTQRVLLDASVPVLVVKDAYDS